MRPYHQISSATQFGRLRKTAVKAAQLFQIETYRLRPIGHWENTTFLLTGERASCNRLRRYLVRIHRPGYNSFDYIRSELSFLKHIREESDVLVPEPMLTAEGQNLIQIQSRGVPEARWVSMFPYISGYTLNHKVRDYRIIGAMMGKLHRFSDRHHQSYGPRDTFHKNLDENLSAYAVFFEALAKYLSKERLLVWQRQSLETYEWINKKYPNSGGLPLIHADMHPGNVITSRNGGSAIIDFDDCVYGPKELDVATALLGSIADSNSREIRTAFLQAYYQEGNELLDEIDGVKHLCVLRMLWLGKWLSSRQDNPRLFQRLPRTISWMDQVLARLMS